MTRTWPRRPPPVAGGDNAMASNDNRIRQAYNEYLGRPASASEVEGWVSGRYHGGGIDDWVQAIRTSGEAQNYSARRGLLNLVPGAQTNRTPDQGPSGGVQTEEGPPPDNDPDPKPSPNETPPGPGADPDKERAREELAAAYRKYLGRPMTAREFAGWWSGTYGWGVAGIEGLPGWLRGIQQSPEGQDRARARTELGAAYLKYLDREMTDAEFEGWWSGQYGWGPKGIQGLPGWLQGIQQSPEAQQYKKSQADGGATGVPKRTGPAPPGWDPTKWADPDHHTVKYDAAAFLYGLTKPSEIAAMVKSAAFQERFPGATFDGKDKIDFGSVTEDGVQVGVIDVLMRADQGGDTSAGLWWGAGPTGGATGPTGPAGPATAGPAGPGPAGPAETGGWTPDAWAAALLTARGGSPLLNPAATPGPPSMGYGPGAGGGGGTMGDMITPYNPLATYSPVPYVPPAPFRPPAYEGATPFQYDPYAAATPFAGPTAADMTADPGYQFRLQQGQEALERSGAARGVTNTGGSLRDILDYGQQAASQEYGNVFGRQRDVYDLNERNRYNAYLANYGNALDAYDLNERNRASAFTTNVANARDAYEMNERNRYQGYTTNELARWQQNQEDESRRSGAYTTNLGTYERQQQHGLRAQDQQFNQAFRNWQEQYNQGRLNAMDTYNRMYGLSTT
jgi:hypothetical protein